MGDSDIILIIININEVYIQVTSMPHDDYIDSMIMYIEEEKLGKKNIIFCPTYPLSPAATAKDLIIGIQSHFM